MATILVSDEHRTLVNIMVGAKDLEYFFGKEGKTHVAYCNVRTVTPLIVARGDGATMEEAFNSCVEHVRRQAHDRLMKSWS